MRIVVEKEISSISEAIDKMRIDMYRMEGTLRAYQGIKQAGIEVIEKPMKAEEIYDDDI
jgi:hypothetical protein|tara:strand:+ start:292 stop:468 length:177 start_codon:yes stop_codon:yes gene_type:complete